MDVQIRPLRRGLYLVTRETADTKRLLRVVEAALDGGAVAVQYRDKSSDAARRLEQARALVALCARYGVPLIVNDDVALARESGAAGVHLGEDDAGVGQAREALGAGAIIGVSCYDEPGRAEQACRERADYVAFGSFYPSPTKPNARRPSLDLLRGAARLDLARVAIGGITGDNAKPLIDAGADLVAVISGIFDAADPRAAAARIAALFPRKT